MTDGPVPQGRFLPLALKRRVRPGWAFLKSQQWAASLLAYKWSQPRCLPSRWPWLIWPHGTNQAHPSPHFPRCPLGGQSHEAESDKAQSRVTIPRWTLISWPLPVIPPEEPGQCLIMLTPATFNWAEYTQISQGTFLTCFPQHLRGSHCKIRKGNYIW